MFSNSAKPRSLASQLIFFFAAAAAFLLFCGLAVFYWMVGLHAAEEDRAALKDKALALSASLSTQAGREALETQLKGLRKGESPVYWVRLADALGHITETPGMNALLPAPVFPPARDPRPAGLVAKDYRTIGKLFSLTTVARQAGDQSYTMQIGQDRSTDDQYKRDFGGLLGVVVVFGIVASVLIAILGTRRGLRPLADMAHSLRRVGPTHLNERLAPATWPNELQPLAVAFDDMLDRLEHSFTRLSQFSADLAHELRTPIANILGEAEVTLTRPRTSDEYRTVIESSIGECRRLSHIVDNLLFLARAEAAESQIQRTTFDGRAAVEKIANFHQLIAEEQQVAITCEGGGEIYADPILFSRAVSNLVENALRFTPAEGTIRIKVAEKDDTSEIVVTDTGAGIEANHLPRIFDRFYRADPSRTSGGAGLGLSLVKSITDLHGGTARAKSEPGKGTSVTITFPKSAPQKGRR